MKPRSNSIVGALGPGGPTTPGGKRFRRLPLRQLTNLTGPAPDRSGKFSTATPPSHVLLADVTGGPDHSAVPLRRYLPGDRTGVICDLRLQLVRHPGATPLARVSVIVSHCNAERCGEDLRPQVRQISDGDGWVAFRTVLPGGPTGARPHLHVHALLEDGKRVSVRLYFPEEIRREAPGKQGTTSVQEASDASARGGLPAGLLLTTERTNAAGIGFGGRLRAAIRLAVRSA